MRRLSVRYALTTLLTTAAFGLVLMRPVPASASPTVASRTAVARCCRGGGHSRSSGGGRTSYGGGHHSGSHGGSYRGGRGSSHKGGTYKNPRTHDRYGRHH